MAVANQHKEIVRIGVVGVGYWGPNLVRTLREIEGVEVLRVADLRAARREFIERRFPGVVATSNADHVICGDDIDAVVIATPPETHAQLAIAAMRHGKHVLVEKPMAASTSEAESMALVAKECRRTLAVGHLFLYHPAIDALRNMLHQGQLGPPFFLSSTRANLGPPNPQTDVLWDLAPHDISIVLNLMGEVPVEVTARGASFVNKALIETAYVNLAFASGRMAQINVSWLTPNKVRRLELVCSEKSVVYDDTSSEHKLQVYGAGIDNRIGSGEQDSVALAYGPGSLWCPALSKAEPLRAECEDFLACAETGREPVSGAKSAVEVVRVLDAASLSMQQGRKCRVRPHAAGNR